MATQKTSVEELVDLISGAGYVYQKCSVATCGAQRASEYF
jgi:hypothetical protein